MTEQNKEIKEESEGTIDWIKPNKNPITTNDTPASIEYAKNAKWKRAK